MARAADARQVMAVFERIGKLYLGRMLTPTWNRLSENGSFTPQAAVRLFAYAYAYEYSGASANYAPAACQALGRSPLGNPAEVWDNFKERLNSAGTNSKHNLLYHNESETRPCSCVFCVWRTDAGGLENLVDWCESHLREDDVETAYMKLRKIRGVGEKIASFFLRDVVLHRPDISPAHDRHLLQPVDLWVDRFARLVDPKIPRSRGAVARWMVDERPEPELANAGMWYFGSQIARPSLVYEEALEKPTLMEELVDRHVQRLAGAVCARWGDDSAQWPTL